MWLTCVASVYGVFDVSFTCCDPNTVDFSSSSMAIWSVSSLATISVCCVDGILLLPSCDCCGTMLKTTLVSMQATTETNVQMRSVFLTLWLYCVSTQAISQKQKQTKTEHNNTPRKIALFCLLRWTLASRSHTWPCDRLDSSAFTIYCLYVHDSITVSIHNLRYFRLLLQLLLMMRWAVMTWIFWYVRARFRSFTLQYIIYVYIYVGISAKKSLDNLA